MKANAYKLLCLVLALCLTVGACPAAFAAELSDDELDAIISGGLTQDQINNLVNGGDLTMEDILSGTGKDPYTPETLPLTPEDYENGYAGVVTPIFPFEPSLCKTVKEATDEVLDHLDAWESRFTVYFWTNEADVRALVEKILDMAKTPNGRERLGDYLRFHVAGYEVPMQTFEWEGKTCVKADFRVTYYTTPEQEQEMEAKFKEVMASLNLAGKTDYEKVKAIYDYITSHVTYDYAHKNNQNYHLQFSAYAALIQGTAVCQGYANLFNRMALAAGLDSRIVTGWGNNEDHGWNIVRVDGKYYNVDATWDAGKTDYKYFLKGAADFPEHTVNYEEHSQQFFAEHPISEANYDPALAPTVVDSGTCGKNATWKLTEDGTLTISGTGFMENYQNVGYAPWTKYNKQILSVVIGEGITNVGDFAFCNGSYSSVTLPGSVTRIGKYAFYGSNLTSVSIPEGVTSISDYAFAECKKLTKASMPETVSSISIAAFQNCKELETVNISQCVTMIADNTFTGCKKLSNVILPDSLTKIGWGAFNGCESITDIVIPEKVTQIEDGAFSGCTGLVSITLPEGIKSIGIRSTFWNCSSLKEVVIPANIADLGENVFAYCESLESVTIKGRVTVAHGAFRDCTSLTKITFENEIAQIWGEAFLNVTATAYYPLRCETWTADVMKDYGGDITWVSYGEPAEHIHEYTITRTEPNCTEQGYTTHTCACGHSYQDDFAEPYGHEESRGVQDNQVEPTCTTPGSAIRTTYCVRCKIEMSRGDKVLPALGHDYVNGKCTRCGEADPDSIPDQTTPALPVEPETCDHLSVTVTSKQEPTCTQAGKTETVTTCQKCGEELGRVATAIHALGHDFRDGECVRCGQEDHEHIPGEPEKEILAEPTCAEDGRYVEITCCTVCGQELSRSETPISIEKLGHANAEPVEENRVEPTCTAAGSFDSVTYCATCGEERSRETIKLPTLGHNESEAQEENRIEATCAAPGSYDLVTRCTVCGAELSCDTVKLPTPDHSWDEGKVTVEPTQVPNGEKTYTCTVCGETRVEKLEHVHSYTDNVVFPTCEKPGYTEHICACGRRYEDGHIKALGHDYREGTCTICGGKDLSYRPPVEETDRCAGSNRFDTAFLTADRMKETLGIEKFDAVVVASGTNFADALSGSYLASAVNAPILLASGVDRIDQLVKDYIQENLNPGGTVYILGGTGAVPEAFAKGLEGFAVRRLAGSDRFETNLLILAEAGVEDQPILVCTGGSFADSLSASATKLPILLVWKELTGDQKAFLDSLSGNKLYILGGEGAVSAEMQKQLSRYAPVTRLGGKDRFETSAMIAREFFREPETAVLAYAWNFPDGLCGGPLAASMDAPLLLTMAGYEKQAMAYAKVNGIKTGIVLGGDSLIPDTTVKNIFN